MAALILCTKNVSLLLSHNIGHLYGGKSGMQECVFWQQHQWFVWSKQRNELDS